MKKLDNKEGPRRRCLRQCGRWRIRGHGCQTEAHFDQTFDVNVKGTLFTVQKALPLFNDGGSIIRHVSI